MSGSRVLVLYSRTGGGHGRVAGTLCDHLQTLDPTCQLSLVDGLEQTDFGMRIDPARVFLTLTTSLIQLYNLNYRLTDSRPGVPVLRWMIRRTFGAGLARTLAEHQPDLVVSTHHFLSPSTVATSEPLPPWVMVVSDLGQPHRVWFDHRLQTVVVPSDDMAEYARRCLGLLDRRPPRPAPALINLGFPIDAGLGRHVPRTRQRSLLVMGGGAGTGSLGRLVRVLSRGLPDHRIVVVCGWNARLRRTLEGWNQPNVVVHGFVQNVPELMAQSDVVITKAGPVTIMEAVAAGRPLIVTDWVGMQERDNVRFVVDHGLGVFCPRLAELCDAVREVYGRYAEFLAAKPANVEHGPDRIARHLLALLDQPRALDPASASADRMSA